MNKNINPLNLGSRRELFIDPYLIEHFEGAALRLHPPQPREIAISFAEPWEGLAPGYCTVLQDETRCRMYYRIMPPGGCEDADPRQLTACAESADGIHWEKPALGLFEVNGSTANNVVWRGNLSHNFTPFLDANPACPPDERYKAVGGTKIEWGGEGLWLLVSPDGIRWRKCDRQRHRRRASHPLRHGGHRRALHGQPRRRCLPRLAGGDGAPRHPATGRLVLWWRLVHLGHAADAGGLARRAG